jgi:Zn-dependent protease
MADFSPKIGSIDGIRIELHWTFILLLIFILLISLYLFVIWVLLFVCVLIHELVHSITSRRNGIKVRKIILYPFGGGSVIDFEKVSPEMEFRISIAGPIASLLIAAVFGIINIYTPFGIVRTTIQTLFLLNIFLGVFNILPWLPLDGGRALRSYLQRTRSFLDATKLAAKVSNAVTVLFVIGTVMYALLVPGYSATYREFIVLFDVVIAFFIYGGAKSELRSALIKENISDLRVKDAITRGFIMLSEDTKIDELYGIFLKRKLHMAIFRKEGKVKMVSSAALQKLLQRGAKGESVQDFGIEIPAIPYNMKLYDATERMRNEESAIAAVMKGGRVIGVLLAQHVEAIIALHISQKQKKAEKGTME